MDRVKIPAGHNARTKQEHYKENDSYLSPDSISIFRKRTYRKMYVKFWEAPFGLTNSSQQTSTDTHIKSSLFTADCSKRVVPGIYFSIYSLHSTNFPQVRPPGTVPPLYRVDGGDPPDTGPHRGFSRGGVTGTGPQEGGGGYRTTPGLVIGFLFFKKKS